MQDRLVTISAYRLVFPIISGSLAACDLVTGAWVRLVSLAVYRERMWCAPSPPHLTMGSISLLRITNRQTAAHGTHGSVYISSLRDVTL
jgi:hypothetical protein